jgi:serine/threonine protein kinase
VKLKGPAQKKWELFTNFGKSASNLEEEANDVSYAIRFEVDDDVGGIENGTGGNRTTPGEWFVNRETGDSIAYCTKAGNFIGTLVAIDGASSKELNVTRWRFAVRARDVSNPTNGPDNRGCGEAGEPKDDANIFDGEFTCICRDGWTGANCGAVDNSASKQVAQTGGIAGGIAGFVILMMILVNVALKHYAYKLSMRKFDFQQEIARLLESGDVDAEQANINETPREIARHSVTITRKLGSGAFGDVCEAILDEGGSTGTPTYPVAVKTVRESGGEAAGELFREAALMQQIAGANTGHPNLVSIIGVVTKGLPLFLVLSICSNGNLLMVLTNEAAKARGGVVWSVKIELMLGAARGMAHLAKKRFVHRDLAARNVLVDSAMNAKIADFGLSRGIHENDTSDDENGGGDYYYRSQSGVFPVRWSAPESMESLRFTSASDVWSYGILMFECISDAQKPYPDLKTNELVISAVSRGHRMNRHASCDPHLYEMLLLCWRSDPTDRPTFDEIAAYLEIRIAKADGDKKNRGFLGGDDTISARIAAYNPDAAREFTAQGAGVSAMRSKGGLINPHYAAGEPLRPIEEDADQYLIPQNARTSVGSSLLNPNTHVVQTLSGAAGGEGDYAEFSNVANLSESEVEAMVHRAKTASAAQALTEADADDLYVQPNSRTAPPVAPRPQDGPEVAPRRPPATSPRKPRAPTPDAADDMYEVPRSRASIAALRSPSSKDRMGSMPEDDFYEVPRAQPGRKVSAWAAVRSFGNGVLPEQHDTPSSHRHEAGFERLQRMGFAAIVGRNHSDTTDDYGALPSRRRMSAIGDVLRSSSEFANQVRLNIVQPPTLGAEKDDANHAAARRMSTFGQEPSSGEYLAPKRMSTFGQEPSSGEYLETRGIGSVGSVGSIMDHPAPDRKSLTEALLKKTSTSSVV